MRQSFRRVITIFVLLSSLMLACSFTIPTSSSGVEFRFDVLPSKANQSSTIANYQAISAWDKTDITYAFVNGTDQLPGNTERDAIRRAFDLWAAQTPLTFNETSDSSTSDIVIGWAVGDHGDGDPFDGPGDILAHSSFPNPYDKSQVFLHFDDDEHWVDSDTQDVDLETVAAHEIGHTLGLAHSSSPNALMYPSYSGPHRFLDQDDIAGVQSIYGASSAQDPAPQAPPQGATPPPATGQDSDGDGLVDGVEVANRMNPLDPDMDKDGVPDGQEVDQGTDPFFPEQADVPADLENQVSDFLTRAIELQIKAYQKGDASIASSIMTGQELANLSADIDALNQQGLVSISEIDYYQSYINDIRVINNSQIEVDTCEVWTTSTYQQSDGQLVDSTDPTLLPQTITIQQQNGNWFITNVNFLDAPAFCR
jgi:matrixin/thrombospondin type 3 repeat protein